MFLKLIKSNSSDVKESLEMHMNDFWCIWMRFYDFWKIMIFMISASRRSDMVITNEDSMIIEYIHLEESASHPLPQEEGVPKVLYAR